MPSVPGHFQCSFSCFRYIRLIAIKKSRAGFSVCHRCTNWLLDVVGKRGGQFAQCAHAIYVSKICLKLFRAFAILDVGRITVPLDDLASGISERHGAIHKPTILPIPRPPKARLALKRLTASERGAPAVGMSLQVFRMNGGFPA